MMEDTSIKIEKDVGFPVRRVSWAAVFGGVAVILVVQLFLAIIGLGIGASTVDPLSEENPVAGIGIGAGIWFGLSTLVAVYLGGWVASRLASVQHRVEGSLHGILAWSLATLLAVYFMTSAAGGILSGAAGIVGQAVSAIGQASGGVAAILADEGEEMLNAQGMSLDEVRNQAIGLLRGGDEQTNQEIQAIFDRMKETGTVTLQDQDKETLVNALVERTGVSQAEAQSTVDGWQTALANAQANLNEAAGEAEQAARQAGDQTAEVVAKSAAWGAIMMALGALAAAMGGFAGTPKEFFTRQHLRAVEHRSAA
jgi:hypothetical protein